MLLISFPCLKWKSKCAGIVPPDPRNREQLKSDLHSPGSLIFTWCVRVCDPLCISHLNSTWLVVAFRVVRFMARVPLAIPSTLIPSVTSDFVTTQTRYPLQEATLVHPREPFTLHSTSLISSPFRSASWSHFNVVTSPGHKYRADTVPK